MNIPTLTCAVLMLACSTSPTRLSAQTVYRCGSTYGQIPCPGGVTVDVNDSRTDAQKAQTDAATRRIATTAMQMERERIALEKSVRGPAMGNHRAAHSGTPPVKVAPAKAQPPKVGNKKTGPEPEHFTASAWADEKRPGKAADRPPPMPKAKDTGTPVKP